MGVQSLFDAIAVQTGTLLAVHVIGAKNCADSYIFIDVIAVIFFLSTYSTILLIILT